MYSVTQRAKTFKQPRGGFLSIKAFEKIKFDDGVTLSEENIHASLVGMAVDYLTRFMSGTPVEEAFLVSVAGADSIGRIADAAKLLKGITGLNDSSIYNACQLVAFDVCFRADPIMYVPYDTIKPDFNTIGNIHVMVERSLKFLKQFGPVTKDGFTLDGGYTKLVSHGDGDFLTKDTLFDFKVSKSAPTTKHTLQILMYYIMGKHSSVEEFKTISKIGFYNPRLNTAYLLDMAKVSDDIMHVVSRDVIGYDE